MTDQNAKSLRWLVNQFPAVEGPKDDTDRISTCIHLYCAAGADAIDTLTAQLAALQTENAELRAALSRVEAERDAAVADLHSMHTLCMDIGGCCPECGSQIDELLDAACTYCKGSGVNCWKNDLDNENKCAAFEWRGA